MVFFPVVNSLKDHKNINKDSGRAEADVLHGFVYSSLRHGSWFVDLVAGINRFDQEHLRKSMLMLASWSGLKG
jgi:hypothetical protein